ncbi:Rne/Rng family ribonuclease [Propionimicrobium lymphophilum]|uniref:Rne/Rng family ribonuclease n=1 Tax=Propionimicrobium lymphophilum TaxID=33012 RepID=UPI00254A4EB4|nr:Rne/Rng family ribonuclease [Propionimicrobium lymphophilum]MDK7709202.1 Rne/Rng family ribonuclease [Propionimicrobium lymphophilum]MDK7733190.1 Rne/Rng family ribonuclease [Propionimicrobium lymphophilum]
MAEKLDIAGQDPAASQDPDLPRPPSGRRAASRPAGPPSQTSKNTNLSAESLYDAPKPASDSSDNGDFKKEESKPANQRVSRSRRRNSSSSASSEVKASDEVQGNVAESNSDEKSRAEASSQDQNKQSQNNRRGSRRSSSRNDSDSKNQSRRRRRRQTPAAETEPSAELEAKLDEVLGAKKAAHKDGDHKSASELLGGKVPTNELGEIDKEAALADLTATIAGKTSNSDAEPSNVKHKSANKSKTGESVSAKKNQEEPSDADQQKKDSAENSEEEKDDNSSNGLRRRRRRGGRRRHGSSNDDSDESNNSDEAKEDAKDEKSEEDNNQQSSGSHRRRRRRRRGGSSSDDDTTIAIRQPRSRSVSDEITSIEGSTRLEAKRQRRREGRSQRRRAPILTEAEFLARRENVSRKMVIRQSDDYTQLAVLEDNMLVEHYVDRKNSASLIGNIYLGRVQNVLPSMEAVFIDIGRGRNAVLYAGEVNWDAFEVASDKRQVEQVFKSGDSVIVQVSKDPVGAKGARLTGHVSLPGRYVVYSPNGHLSGISRKLPDKERARLKKILDETLSDSASVIVRTAAEGATEENLIHDVDRLKAQWEVIEKKAKRGGAPAQLYAEPDLTLRTIRDIFTEDFEELIIAGQGSQNDAWESVSQYVEMIAPQLADRLKKWDSQKQGDLFSVYRIDEQISKALERKVFLPSGGSLVIDRTEAMTVIDVNTGKFTGSGGNLEETVTKNNLEAAEEIVRQLRLRDLGGIIVVDFIDMVLPANRDLLLRRLVECLSRDRTRHQVSEVTSLGLVQMTRKRIGTGLAEAFTTECEACGGRGYHRYDTPVASQAPADGGERHGRKNGRKNSKNGKGKNKNN